MIKEKDLLDVFRNVRFANGEGVDLSAVKMALSDEADKNALPIAFYSDQIKFGGLIGGSVEDCLVLYHPEHRSDYYNLAIRIKRQGKYAFLTANSIGKSKMGGKIAVAENARADRQGKSMSYKVGSMIGSAIAGSGKNRAKYEEEQNWYVMVGDIFDAIVE